MNKRRFEMGSIFSGDLRSLEEKRADEAHGARAAAARAAGLIELDASRVTRRGKYFIHAGLLYEPVLHLVVDAAGVRHDADRGTYYFIETDVGDPLILARSSGPATVEDLDAAEAAEAEEAIAVAHARQSLPRRPVTVADLERRQLPNLAEAAARVIEHGGTIEARSNGELVVELSDQAVRRRDVADAALVLFSAKELVLAALAESRTRKQRLTDVLPASAVRAGGGAG